MENVVKRTTLLGMLAAALMCVVLLGAAAPQEAYAAQGWNSNNKGFWYEYDAKGHYYKNGWQKITVTMDTPEGPEPFSFWYYFQKNGYAKQGWLKDGKYWYYLEPVITLDSDYSYEIGDMQYFAHPATRMTINGKNYQSPYMAFNQQVLVSGKCYHFDKSGRMTTGWAKLYEVTDSGGFYHAAWVYANKSGALTQGWKKVGGKWYAFGIYDNDDKKWYGYDTYNGWRNIKGVDYYFNKNTAMVTGWQKIDGKWYYFAKSGALQKNKWVGNYWLGADGVMATDAWVDNNKYYVDKNGKWVKGKKK